MSLKKRKLICKEKSQVIEDLLDVAKETFQNSREYVNVLDLGVKLLIEGANPGKGVVDGKLILKD